MVNTGPRSAILLIVACCLLQGTSLLGQSPAERAMLATWDDSLERASTRAELGRLETASTAVAGAIGEFRHDRFLLRTAQLSNNRNQLRDAADRLDYASHAYADWVWPDYALARAFIWLHVHDAQPMPLTEAMEGSSNVEIAWTYLRRAVTTDPEFDRARNLATTLLVAAGDRELRPDHEATMAVLLKRRFPDPDILLVRGRELRVAGKHDSALAAFDRAAATGGDHGRLQLERARALAGLGDSVGAGKAYWSGLQDLTAVGREAYRYDLAWILAPDSLKLFDKVSRDSVIPWMHRFWDERDAAAAHDPGQRLTEQFRRWNYVFAHYRLFDAWRHTAYKRVEFAFEGLDPCVKSDSSLYWLLAREQPFHEGDIRNKEPVLDHRGLIYLKHGAPWRTFEHPGSPRPESVNIRVSEVAARFGASFRAGPDEPPRPLPDCNPFRVGLIGPNDAWLYWFGGALRVLNFRGSCALGTSTPTTLTGYVPLTKIEGKYVDWIIRTPFLDEYAEAVDELQKVPGPATCLAAVNRMIAKSRDDAHTATTTDSDSPFLLAAWKTVVQFFALGHVAENSGEALVSFAFGGSIQASRDSAGRYEYPISFRLVAYNRATGNTVTVDTVRRFLLADSLHAGQSLTGTFDLPLSGGDWQIALKAGQGIDSIGGYALEKDVHVDAKPGLSLSDMVLGIAGARGWKATDGAPYPVNALGAYSAGATAEMFYEVRGVAPGQRYRTTVEVKSTDPTSKSGIRLTTAEVSGGSVNYVRRSLALNRLLPGVYRLLVTIESGSSRVVRERPLLVVKR